MRGEGPADAKSGNHAKNLLRILNKVVDVAGKRTNARRAFCVNWWTTQFLLDYMSPRVIDPGGNIVPSRTNVRESIRHELFMVSSLIHVT